MSIQSHLGKEIFVWEIERNIFVGTDINKACVHKKVKSIVFPQIMNPLSRSIRMVRIAKQQVALQEAVCLWDDVHRPQETARSSTCNLQVQFEADADASLNDISLTELVPLKALDKNSPINEHDFTVNSNSLNCYLPQTNDTENILNLSNESLMIKKTFLKAPSNSTSGAGIMLQSEQPVLLPNRNVEYGGFNTIEHVIDITVPAETVQKTSERPL